MQNGSGTVGLRATIPNADRHFWPGQFVNVRLILSTARGAVLIPNQAAQISQQGPFVYVVKQDNTADLRQITLGQRQGDQVVVTKGLSDGELVVVTGQLSVHPGAQVRVDASLELRKKGSQVVCIVPAAHLNAIRRRQHSQFIA